MEPPSPADRSARRFFPLLLLVTAVPLCSYLLSEWWIPERPAAARASLWVTFLGSSGHVASSFFFYTDARVRRHMWSEGRARFFAVPALVVVATALFFQTFAGTSLLAYAVTLYWTWQTHHYSRQNQGILAFAGRAYGPPPSELERLALTLTGYGGVLGALPFVAPLGDTVLADFDWHVRHVALAVYACGLVAGAVAQVRIRLAQPRTAALRSAVPAVLLLFYAPLFVFDSPRLAVGSYAMAHGLQYLVFMGTVSRVPRAAALRRAAVLVAFVVGLGLGLEALQKPGPFGDYRMAVFGGYLGLVMWHFLLDAGIWRLSEPFQRGYMSERFHFLARPPA